METCIGYLDSKKVLSQNNKFKFLYEFKVSDIIITLEIHQKVQVHSHDGRVQDYWYIWGLSREISLYIGSGICWWVYACFRGEGSFFVIFHRKIERGNSSTYLKSLIGILKRKGWRRYRKSYKGRRIRMRGRSRMKNS